MAFVVDNLVATWPLVAPRVEETLGGRVELVAAVRT